MLFAFFQIASNTNENFNNFTIKIIFVTLELLPSHSLQRVGATKKYGTFWEDDISTSESYVK